MELDKKDAEIISKAIHIWEQNETISPETAQTLKNSYQIKSGNADAIATYALISALSCGLLAFAALVIDEKWIELLRTQWGFSESVVAGLFTLISSVFIYLAHKREIKNTDSLTTSETYNLGIILSIAIAITYWTRSLGNMNDNYALPLFIAALAYGISGFFLNSRILWIVMLLTFAGWWGAQTHYWANGNFRFAGMNYPLRMTVFGLIIWASTYPMFHIQKLRKFADTHANIGLFMFLTAAWTLSIFGNYDDLEKWTSIKQGHFWYWALAFTALLGGLLAYALQNGNDKIRDFTLVFFLINIYTRYFEYFWDRTNKGIFFAILALSFWLVGRKAEQWRSKQKLNH